MFVFRSIAIVIFLLFFILDCPVKGFAQINAIYTSVAYTGQEVYNWVDVVNDPYVSILTYQTDGVTVEQKQLSNETRYVWSHKYNTPGIHFFDVIVSFTDGRSPSVRTWSLSVVSPTFNLVSAILYADQYALKENDTYPPFDSDCTSFVSQILHEGGGFPEENGHFLERWKNWYYDGSDYFDYSNTWTVVSDFYQYMDDYKHIINNTSLEGTSIVFGGIAGGETYLYPPLSNGNTVKYEFQGGGLHNGFVTGFGIDENGKLGPLVDTHTSNRKWTNWGLVSYNSQWQETKVTLNHVNWAFSN